MKMKPEELMRAHSVELFLAKEGLSLEEAVFTETGKDSSRRFCQQAEEATERALQEGLLTEQQLYLQVERFIYRRRPTAGDVATQLHIKRERVDTIIAQLEQTDSIKSREYSNWPGMKFYSGANWWRMVVHAFSPD